MEDLAYEPLLDPPSTHLANRTVQVIENGPTPQWLSNCDWTRSLLTAYRTCRLMSNLDLQVGLTRQLSEDARFNLATVCNHAALSCVQSEHALERAVSLATVESP